MTKSKREDSEAVEAEALPQPEPTIVVTVQAPERKISFEAWATRRGTKEGHFKGMRAFVKNIGYPRTAKEWDELFKTY